MPAITLGQAALHWRCIPGRKHLPKCKLSSLLFHTSKHWANSVFQANLRDMCLELDKHSLTWFCYLQSIQKGPGLVFIEWTVRIGAGQRLICRGLVLLWSSKVGVNGDCTCAFNSNKVVRQSCIVALFLFHFYINAIEKELVARGKDLPRFGSCVIPVLLYADDAVLIANGLQLLLDIFYDFMGGLYMNINHKKLFNMICAPKNTCSRSYHFPGIPIAKVTNFNYLGLLISSDLGLIFCPREQGNSRGQSTQFLGCQKALQINPLENFFFFIRVCKFPRRLMGLAFGATLWRATFKQLKIDSSASYLLCQGALQLLLLIWKFDWHFWRL